MWYVEAHNKDKYERWEGLTEEQSRDIHYRYYDEGYGYVRSGRMDVENACSKV